MLRSLERATLRIGNAASPDELYELVLSPETVKSHVAAILEKLNVSDRTQAAIFAVRNGLVEAGA